MSTWKRIALACLSFVAIGLAPIGAAYAQGKVTVTSANPSSAYQGTIALDVIVSGSGFNSSAKVYYYVSGTTNPGGITVKNVKFNSSTELVSTIDVAADADLAGFDIVVVIMDTGRKGKGTTLFTVKQKPNEEPLPTYPPARAMQSFTSNGGTTASTSRLYMFGGDDSSGTAIADLWSYANAGSTGATWSYVPAGSYTAGQAPYPRKGGGWSCGAGTCVLAGGLSTKVYNDTWIFNESALTWSAVTCGRRAVCPPARAFPAMAYDPISGVHVVFGGYTGNGTWSADTYTFSSATRTWTKKTSAITPPARESAAATYVPGVGVVLFGGADWWVIFNDMYVWNGAEWLTVTSTVVSDPPRAVPSIWGHSLAWDPSRGAMIVAKGLLTSGWAPSEDIWYVTFSNSTGAWRATWTLASGIGCQAAASSPPDAVVHAGARMAFDPVANTMVFFGGTSSNPLTIHGNTVECQ